MIRFLLRFLGLWLLAGGFVALVLDGVRSIASSRLLYTPLGDAWAAASATSLGQALGDADLPAGGWSHLAAPLLQAPLAAVLIVLGLLLLLAGRRRA
ncbi:hypothetical protein [Ancylobacter oerskovii]|uniref:PetM family of cytochrome b6f complex subunit 7 n=1 Tax=Ancylobacter oerskovii TaxID=459519 RepID=A0ABW4YX28_9HYPH|nr:hypothetical protein [Ancylobacter oerskovii]MBS7542334.1 hypothetical protein [Ancylobacter oerskovii]